MKTFLFNFKAQFVPLVESGAKFQTVRRTRRDGRMPTPGDVVACYTGLRTRSTRLLLRAPVIECAYLDLDFVTKSIAVDGQELGAQQADAFAVADGFETFESMLAWFQDEHGDEAFSGFVTKWDPSNG